MANKHQARSLPMWVISAVLLLCLAAVHYGFSPAETVLLRGELQPSAEGAPAPSVVFSPEFVAGNNTTLTVETSSPSASETLVALVNVETQEVREFVSGALKGTTRSVIDRVGEGRYIIRVSNTWTSGSVPTQVVVRTGGRTAANLGIATILILIPPVVTGLRRRTRTKPQEQS